MAYATGQIVEHKALPELGRARILYVSSAKLTLLFETRTGGETKHFALPNADISTSRDQSDDGFPSGASIAKAAKRGLAKAKAAAKAKKAARTSQAPA